LTEADLSRNQTNIAARREIKQSCTRGRTTQRRTRTKNHEKTQEKDIYGNHLFIMKEKEKDTYGRF